MTKRKVAPHRDTLWLSTADAINLIFGIIIHVILTRVLISSDYGLFILLLDFFHVCVIIVDLGMPTLIGRDGERLGIHLNKVIRKIIKIQIVPFLIGIFLFSINCPAFCLLGSRRKQMLYNYNDLGCYSQSHFDIAFSS